MNSTTTRPQIIGNEVHLADGTVKTLEEYVHKDDFGTHPVESQVSQSRGYYWPGVRSPSSFVGITRIGPHY